MTFVRVGRRVRALGRERARRRSEVLRRLEGLLRAADLRLDGGAFVRRTLAGAAAGLAGGAMLFGAPGAVAGPPLVIVGSVLWLRHRVAGRLARIEDALPRAVRAIADAVRAGLNVPQSLSVACEETPAPLEAELRGVIDQLSVGISLPDALASFATRCPVPGADLFAVALSTASRSGVDLPPVLDCIVEAALDGRRLRREMRAATAQGRLTAIVVGALPAVFLLVMGAEAREEARFLFREPAGWALLGSGALLEAAGFAWINRMARVR